MLPQSLEAATIRMMQQGSVAREILGDDFVEHFGGTREHEVRLWNSAVTNWEGKPQVFAAPCRSMVADRSFCSVERYLELV
jgi:glutamine synthetase